MICVFMTSAAVVMFQEEQEAQPRFENSSEFAEYRTKSADSAMAEFFDDFSNLKKSEKIR